MDIGPETLQKLQLLAGDYVDSFADTLGKITNVDVQFSIDQLEESTQEDLGEFFSGEIVKVSVPATSGLEETVTLVFGKDTVSMMADLMMMGDGTAEFNPDEHLETCQEIVSQMFGPVATHLTSNLPDKAEFDTPKAEIVDFANLSEYLSQGATTIISGKIGDNEVLWALNFTESQATLLAELAEVEDGASEEEIVAERVELEQFPDAAAIIGGNSDNVDLLLDLELQVSIELGRTKLFVRDVINLGQGSVVELDKLSGDPVDIFINDKKFAEGEVVVVDENFGVRITDVISPSDRVKKLGS